MSQMRRIRMTLAYDGTDFHGWQTQPGLATIQGTIEAVMLEIEKRPVHVAGSGRTDAGVHARAQVAAVTIENPIPLFNLRKAMNRLLPPAIRVMQVEEAAAEFHPRFDAVAKTYQYTIERRDTCSPFDWRWVHHHPYPLNEERMIALAPVFEGEHDFSAFAASDAVEGSKVRTVFESKLEREGSRLVYRVRGSGFLKQMVRNMVGTLLEAGKGNVGEANLRAWLKPEGRAGPTAPAKGLTLVSVSYG
jgi:tRNA pseudouridine38-40 synthase